ncbi:MAG: sigma 54-interacting transcriptional regulator [Deltaproteobacteria bacterium]|jgi:arginine utilization regulatory protein|nr:sigma 54-interacting transcriptional regulator [Deltaproteobacteria bacterium]
MLNQENQTPESVVNLQEFLDILAFSPEQLKLIFDNFPLGVIVTDTEGKVIYYNLAHAKIDGVPQHEMLGRKEIEALAPITGPNVMSICQKTGKPILGYIYPYRTFSGTVVNAAYWVFPVKRNNVVKAAICFTQPLLGEFNKARAYTNPPVQWPGSVPIQVPETKIVGKNPEFLKSLEQIKTNAANHFPILISGETGSGKEILAKLTHQASKRRNKPYLALNCAAIPSNLLEGLLFGTTKGSFTGAIDRPGMLAEANGGTLYLDELDSMPLELQPKLLRTIQEMKTFRVGSTVPVDLDIKLVVSIGSSPHMALSSGKLRPDLFYRVAVVLVNIPPLRNRLDDLPLLCDFFINKYNNLLGKQALKIDAPLFEVMAKYHWPGNVRELEHMLAGSIAQVEIEENIIGLKHVHEHYLHAFSGFAEGKKNIPLTEYLDAEKTSSLFPIHLTDPAAANDSGYLNRIREEEESLINSLKTSKGSITKASKNLGISRQLFSYRLRKYGIRAKDYRRKL